MVKKATRKHHSMKLYSERPVRNQRELLEYIEALDEDEGIRLQGDLENHTGGGFIFVGFYRGSYCVNICDKIWNPNVKKHIAGGNDEWYYFDTGEQAFNFVMKEAKRPISAWLY